MKKALSVIIAVGCALTFFACLGPAPGYEALFAALCMTCSLAITGIATRALVVIQRKEKSGLTRQSKNRHFYDISLKGECQLW